MYLPRRLCRPDELRSNQMETFHILHLAASWPGQARVEQTIKPPISTLPVTPVISPPPQPSSQGQPPSVSESDSHGDLMTPRPSIRAAAAQMVFASRTSQEFITPEQVVEIEAWSGRAVLEALTSLDLDQNVCLRFIGKPYELDDICVDTETSSRERERLGFVK